LDSVADVEPHHRKYDAYLDGAEGFSLAMVSADEADHITLGVCRRFFIGGIACFLSCMDHWNRTNNWRNLQGLMDRRLKGR